MLFRSKVYDEKTAFGERESSSAEPDIISVSVGQREVSVEASVPEIIVLIGPEGDFSEEEVRLALSEGYVPVHLGASRLRTETAALLCVEAVYGSLML